MSIRLRVWSYMAIAACVVGLGVWMEGRPAKGDAGSGRAAFEKRCTGCHALDREKMGPRLGGVVGRKAGAVAGFGYSEAVKKSGVVWTEAVLDHWLTDPESVIAGTDMSFRLDDADERASIIAYLKESR